MHHIASTKSKPVAIVIIPEIVTDLKRILIEQIRDEEVTNLADLTKRLSRRYLLRWVVEDYALFRSYLTAVVEQSGVLLSACVIESNGMPLQEFFDSARTMSRLDDEDPVETVLEFWQSEFERLCIEVQRITAKA